MPETQPDFQMWVVFGLITAVIISYAYDRVQLELTSLAAIGFLLIFFYFFPVTGPGSGIEGGNVLDARQLLAGFADPALITILALLVIGQGIVQSGALEEPVDQLVRYGLSRPYTIIALVLFSIAVVSAVLNNTPVVAIFIPIMGAMVERFGRPVSKVMMPLSFAAILGGMVTLMGSSTNLLVSGRLETMGHPGIGFFDFAVPGMVLAAVGLVYVIFIMPRMLPAREPLAEELAGPGGRQFIAQLEVSAGNTLDGAASVAGMFPELKDMTVRLVQRGEGALLPPYDDVTLEDGDVVVVAATRKALAELLALSPDILHGVIREDLPEDETAEVQAPTGEQMLAEVVVAPASRMIGRSLGMLSFRYQTGCIVLGIQRRSRMIRAAMNDIRLDAGDVLLVIGERDDMTKLRSNRDVLLLEWSAAELPSIAHAKRAMAILGTVVGLAATDLVPIVIAALLGAAAMIAGNCLNLRQASRALDQRVIFIIATALAMGAALELTGGAMFLAHGMIALLAGASPAVMLSCFFLLIVALTNILSNNATAVLFTPIAFSVAQSLDVDPLVFVYAVIFAANCSFATPMSYQTNLLIMGPGHYRFADFMRAGLPLSILIWITFSLFAPWYYGI